MPEETTHAEAHAAATITDQNFSEVAGPDSGLVFVDFWAAWCGPCRMMAPIVEDLAKKYADQEGLTVAKMDVDANPATSEKLRIMSIPTFKMFFKGEEIGEAIGAVDQEELEALITSNLHHLQGAPATA